MLAFKAITVGPMGNCSQKHKTLHFVYIGLKAFKNACKGISPFITVQFSVVPIFLALKDQIICSVFLIFDSFAATLFHAFISPISLSVDNILHPFSVHAIK